MGMFGFEVKMQMFCRSSVKRFTLVLAVNLVPGLRHGQYGLVLNCVSSVQLWFISFTECNH